jgi:hypothetical protein
MRVLEVILEKESDGLLNNLIGNLKKTPKVKGPIEQFKNDPNKIHSSARAKFRQWATRSGLAYLNTNVMERGSAGTTRIAFYSFVAMMQKECGLPVTGILDVATMRGFANNQSKFSDSYMNSRVEKAIASSGINVPRGCIDVVRAIENKVSSWTSTYATYHDRNGKLDFGIGPGQVEPKTYGDVKGGTFDFGNLDHVASINLLTKAMIETINLKMYSADRIAKKEDSEITTLEHFAKAWNYKNYSKAKGVYGNDQPMRPGLKTSLKPKLRPDPNAPKTPPTKPDKTTPVVDVPDEPSYFDKAKSGIGKMIRGYFDSEG